MALALGTAAITLTANTSTLLKGLSKVSAAVATAIKPMLVFGGALTAATAAGTGFALKLAADMEKTEVAFGTLLGSADMAKKLLAELDQFAASTPFQLPGITQAGRQLLAFGVVQEQIVPSLRAIGDVAAGIDAPLTDIAEIYGKARVQGRLFMEDINQLTGRGIPIISELAKQFGVAESEVRGLVENGQINFGHLQQVFIDLTSEGGRFAGMMKAQSQTLGGLWSTLKDNLMLVTRTFGEALLPTAKEVVDWFLSKMPVLTSWAKSVAGGITSGVGWIKKLMPTLRAVWDVVRTIGGVIKDMVVIVGQKLWGAFAKFTGINVLLWNASNILKVMPKLIRSIIPYLKLIPPAFKFVLENAGLFLKQWALKAAVYVLKPFDWFSHAVTVVGDLAGTAAMNVWQIIKNLAHNVMTLGRNWYTTMENSLNQLQMAQVAYIGNIWKSMKNLAHNIQTIWKNLWDKGDEMIANFVKSIPEHLESVLTSIKNLGKNIHKVLEAIFKSVASRSADPLLDLLFGGEDGKGNFLPVGEGIFDNKTLNNAIVDLTTGTKGIADGWEEVGDKISGAFDSFKDGLAGLTKGTRPLLDSVVDLIIPEFEDTEITKKVKEALRKATAELNQAMARAGLSLMLQKKKGEDLLHGYNNSSDENKLRRENIDGAKGGKSGRADSPQLLGLSSVFERIAQAAANRDDPAKRTAENTKKAADIAQQQLEEQKRLRQQRIESEARMARAREALHALYGT